MSAFPCRDVVNILRSTTAVRKEIFEGETAIMSLSVDIQLHYFHIQTLAFGRLPVIHEEKK